MFSHALLNEFFAGSRALRSMENPREFSDPDTYQGMHWVNVEEGNDNGGVHTNSGVQNEGIGPLTIYDLQFIESESFSISMDHELPLEIGRSESIELYVKFSPVSLGPYEDSLTITSSDPRDSLKVIHFSGEGLDSTTSLPNKNEIQTAELVAYPNPFTNQLFINFKLPGNEFITIEILDIAGRMVYSSSWNALPEETHEIGWNDLNQGHTRFSSGLYLVKLRTSHQVITTPPVKQLLIWLHFFFYIDP